MPRRLTTTGLSVLLGLVSLIPAVLVYRLAAGPSGMRAGLRLITFECADAAGLVRFFAGVTCAIGVLVVLQLVLRRGGGLLSDRLVQIGILEQRDEPTTTQPAAAQPPRNTRSATKLLTALLIVAVPLAVIYGVVFLWSAIPWGTVENFIDKKTANDPGVIGRNVAILFWGGVGVLVVLCAVIAVVTAMIKGPGRR